MRPELRPEWSADAIGRRAQSGSFAKRFALTERSELAIVWWTPCGDELTVEVGLRSGRTAPVALLLGSVMETALDEVCRASACAALAKTLRMGWLKASSSRTRRVLRTMPGAAIFSSSMRMVAMRAWATRCRPGRGGAG